MASARLIDRQRALLDYLTSGAAIFDGAPPDDPALAGLDAGRLRLEARFSFRKRMDKVRRVLPLTFALLGEASDDVARAFVAACRPVSIARIENARSFHDFLISRAERGVLDPPWLCDVAACEIAFARVRSGIARRGPADSPAGTLLLARNVALVRCNHAVGILFGHAAGTLVPERRDTLLAMVLPRGAARPRVFELTPEAHEFLTALADGRSATSALTTLDFAALRDELAACDLIESGA